METETIVIGVGVAPVIALLINPIKRFIPSDLMIYVAVVGGLAWTLTYHWTQGELARETIMASIMLGVVTGTAAAGAYDVLSTVVERSAAAARVASALTVLPTNEDE